MDKIIKIALLGNVAWKFVPFSYYALKDSFNGIKYNYEPPKQTMYFVHTIITSPIAEEFIFRGLIQSYLLRSMTLKNKLIVSSLLFSMCHFSFKDLSLDTLLFRYTTLYIASLIHGMQLERTNSILIPILSHGLHNYFCIYLSKYHFAKFILGIYIIFNTTTVLFNYLSIEEILLNKIIKSEKFIISNLIFNEIIKITLKYYKLPY